ncbi:MAG: hypothetical protein QM783_02010 [Phycisphaerales bacterium]
MKLPALLLAAALLTACASSQNGTGNASGIDDANGTTVASAKQCMTCAAKGVDGKQAFGWFKGLAGKNGAESRWVAHSKDKDGKDHEMVVKYKVLSAGSTVCETIAPGTPYEMITVYHLDHDKLTATHYCAAGNQPRMQATVCACDAAAKQCIFKFLDGTNLDPSKEGFMGNQDYTFTGPDTLTINWRHLGPGGKQDGDDMSGNFKRVM